MIIVGCMIVHNILIYIVHFKVLSTNHNLTH